MYRINSVSLAKGVFWLKIDKYFELLRMYFSSAQIDAMNVYLHLITGI